MRRQRVVVLHTQSSTDPNIRVGAEGTPTGSPSISTFDTGSPILVALREKPGIKIEAPSFDVKLIMPLEFLDATAAPPMNWGVEAVGAVVMRRSFLDERRAQNSGAPEPGSIRPVSAAATPC